MPIITSLKRASENIARGKILLNTPIDSVVLKESDYEKTIEVENKHLDTILENFETFDTAKQGDLSKADGRISKNDLKAAAKLGGDIGAAAQYILDHPDLFEFLDTGYYNSEYSKNVHVEGGTFYTREGSGDGIISERDINSYINKRDTFNEWKGIIDRINNMFPRK